MNRENFAAILDAQLEERRARKANKYPAAPDWKAAITDYFLMSRNHVANAEPMARAWKRDNWNLDGIRTGSGLSSGDFANALESGAKELLVQKFADLSGDIRAICGDLAGENYRPTTISALGLKVPTEVIEELRPPKLPVGISESSEKGTLKSYVATLSFSYQIWVTKGDTILSGLSEYASLFALLEVQELVAKLESATLPTSASTPLTTAGLGKAAAALRLQQNSAGQAANLPIAVVVVSPEQEITARTLITAAGNFARVVVLPLSSASTYFVLADPAISAPIARITLRGSKGPRLELNSRRSIYEGDEIAVSHDFAIAHLDNQPGIVKCTA